MGWPLYPAWIRFKIIHMLPWLLNWLQQCLCIASIRFPTLTIVLGSCLILMLCSFPWHDKRWRDPRERIKVTSPPHGRMPIWWVISQQRLNLRQVHCDASSQPVLTWWSTVLWAVVFLLWLESFLGICGYIFRDGKCYVNLTDQSSELLLPAIFHTSRLQHDFFFLHNYGVNMQRCPLWGMRKWIGK